MSFIFTLTSCKATKLPPDSTFPSSLLISEIESVEIGKHSKFFLTLTTDSTVYTITTKYAVEAECWFYALQGAQEVYRDLSCSKYKSIKYDVKMFYKPKYLTDLKLLQKPVESILRPLLIEKNPDVMIEKLIEMTLEFDFICDTFYAHKPLNFSVFKQVVIFFHNGIRDKLIEIWNDHLNVLNAKNILDINLAYQKYTNALAVWKITDRNFAQNDSTIAESF